MCLFAEMSFLEGLTSTGDLLAQGAHPRGAIRRRCAERTNYVSPPPSLEIPACADSWIPVLDPSMKFSTGAGRRGGSD